MWESKEQKRRFYSQMYGGFNPDEPIRLKPHQIEALEEMRRDFETSNPCMEIGLGDFHHCMFPVSVEEAYPANYQLLLL